MSNRHTEEIKHIHELICIDPPSGIHVHLVERLVNVLQRLRVHLKVLSLHQAVAMLELGHPELPLALPPLKQLLRLEPRVPIPGHLATNDIHQHIGRVLVLRDAEAKRHAKVDDSYPRRTHIDSPTSSP